MAAELAHAPPVSVSDALAFLVIAGGIAPALARFKINPVMTFLALGVLVGPFGLSRWAGEAVWVEPFTIDDVAGAAAIAEVGVALLLFVVGLEISASRLRAMRRLVFGLGGAQIAVVAVVIAGGASAWGNPPAASVAIGLAFALSSTAIVAQILIERGQLGAPAGQASFAVLLMQDLAVVPIVLFVTLAAGGGDRPVWLAAGEAIGVAIVVVGAIVFAGRLFVRPALRFVAETRRSEMFTGAVLLLVALTSTATAAAGLSIALGAFLAGLLLAETEYRHDVDAAIAPFKGLFLGLFFLSVGMGLDIGAAVSEPLWLALAVLGLMMGKALIVTGLARAFGLGWPAAIETGLLLCGAGEFAFVILGVGARSGLIAADVAPFMILVAGMSMALTPLVAIAARRLALALEARAGMSANAGAIALSGHVIVVGFGRVGRMLGELLGEERIAYRAVDSEPRLVAAARKIGAAVDFGDARRRELLERLSIANAAAVVVTMDDPHAVEAVVAGVARDWPRVPIFARARDRAHALRLMELGATSVTPETLEASLDLSQTVLRELGLTEDAARSLVDARRRRELDKLRRAAAPGPEPAVDVDGEREAREGGS